MDRRAPGGDIVRPPLETTGSGDVGGEHGADARSGADQVRPFADLAEEASALLRLLWDLSGLDVLMVTRINLEEDRQEVVAALVGGDLTVIATPTWSGSACLPMTSRAAPAVAPHISDVPAYAAAANLADTGLSCYAGAVIERGDGTAFGTVCGFGRKPRDDSMWDLLPRFRTVARCLGTLLTVEDHADERVAQAHAQHAVALGHALTDPVTGLANRTGFERALEIERSRQERFGHVVAVVVCDVDNLKAVNDRDGHAAGDAVLADVANALRSVSRASDILARAGGDEFVLLLPGEHEDGPAVSRLQVFLADLPVSFGAADTVASDDILAAWHTADQRMYEHKNRKRE